jgi:hypothetical protein
VPTLEYDMKPGSLFAGTPQPLIEHLNKLEVRLVGMKHVNGACARQTVMLEQFRALPRRSF